jgi:hypothetical protein
MATFTQDTICFPITWLPVIGATAGSNVGGLLALT